MCQRANYTNLEVKDYPLIKIIPYEEEFLIYDSKSNFIFTLEQNHFELFKSFLLDSNNKDSFDNEKLEVLKHLKYLGAFDPGFLEKRFNLDRKQIKNDIENFEKNIITRKFILEVTNACNLVCKYCPYAIGEGKRIHSHEYMSKETAEKAIKFYFNRFIRQYEGLSEEKKQKLLRVAPPGITFYGGEPFLNFSTIKFAVEYFNSLDWNHYGISVDQLTFSLTTNLTVFTDEIIEFIVANRFALAVSIDGPKNRHDKNRIMADGNGTFEIIYKNLEKLSKYSQWYCNNFLTFQAVTDDKLNVDDIDDFAKKLKTDLFPEKSFFEIRKIKQTKRGSFVSESREFLNKMNSNEEDFFSNYKKEFSSLNYFKEKYKANSEYRELAQVGSRYSGIQIDRPLNNYIQQSYGTCPMGFDQLLVAPDGNFYMCMMTDESLELGSIDSGYNIDKITNYYFDYHKNLSNSECKNCWAYRICNLCAATLSLNGKFFMPSKEECKIFKKNHEIGIKQFYYLQSKEDIFEELYTTLKPEHIGSIDISTF